MSKTVCIIPARWGSTRFPGKPLAPIRGATGEARPLILRTLDVARKAECFDDVYVATDDERIAEVVWKDGWDCILTSESARNGTERCAEAVALLSLPANQLVVNLQGDSLLTPPAWLATLKAHLHTGGPSKVATVIYQRVYGELPAPGDVEAIVDDNYHALYFTRGPLAKSPRGWYQHYGVYAYTVGALQSYAMMQPTRREEAEQLEQLRFIENGWSVQCVQPLGPGGVAPEREVNYPDDIAVVEEALRKWNIE